MGVPEGEDLAIPLSTGSERGHTLWRGYFMQLFMQLFHSPSLLHAHLIHYSLFKNLYICEVFPGVEI